MSFNALKMTKAKVQELPKSYLKLWKPIVKNGTMFPACPDEADRFYKRQFTILDLDIPGFTENRVTAFRRNGFKPIEIVVGKYDVLDPKAGILADLAEGLEAEIKANKEEHAKVAADWEKNREVLEQDEQEVKERYKPVADALKKNVEAAKAKGESAQTLTEKAGV